MSDINAAKSRFPSARPWTASGSRSPFTEESSKLEEGKKENKTENLQQQKRKNTVERSFVGGRRQRRAAARHAPTATTDDLVEEEEKKEEIIVKSRPKKPKRASSTHYRKYSVPRHESPELTIKSMAEKEQSFKGLSSIRFRKSRVADSSGINAVTQNQTEFLKKFGLSTLIQADDHEEYKKNKLKYILNKLVFDSNAGYFYYWLAIVSMAYVYNLIVVIARAVFYDIAAGYLWFPWMLLDVFFDFIYFLDMFIRSRTGFLDQGLLVRDVGRTTKAYVKSLQFRLDICSFFPVDLILMIIFRRPQPIYRMNRLLRRDRIQKFMEQTETRSSMPNIFRVAAVVWYICVIIHWNACFYFLISESVGLGSDSWVYGSKNIQSMPPGVSVSDTLARRYIYSFYWSTLILTTIGEVPWPQQNIEFVFVTLDLMCGVLIFATIVGNVGTMISNMSAARADFQTKMDSIKQFMELRRVSKALEIRVIKWFDYLWDNKQGLSDQQVLEVLPDKLQAEIAMHDCEAGLLAELVLKLKLQVFSPSDFICRKGDIGREMYIVKRGKLQVVADDGITVYATLIEGAVFGELSILNIAGTVSINL
uniref:Cyclic nucleotide-binding domain-containing protein n=1 Tax=Panagrolaimus sp. PS1159 TaxID=55785 RepID=A0AC35GUI9_9BILA